MNKQHAEAEAKMKHAVEHLHAELKRLRTGRASVNMLDGVQVEYYGSLVPIKNVATVTVADATMLVAQPYDPSSISAIDPSAMHCESRVSSARSAWSTDPRRSDTVTTSKRDCRNNSMPSSTWIRPEPSSRWSVRRRGRQAHFISTMRCGSSMRGAGTRSALAAAAAWWP